MKTEFPRYKRGEVDKIKNRISPKNKQIINEFIEYCKISAGEKKLQHYEMYMYEIYDVMERPLSDISLLDLRKFLAVLNQSDRVKGDIKKTLKRFLRWFYKDWSERFDSFNDIRIYKEINHEKINESTLISEEDIKKMVRKADSLKLKALVILLYETAARPEEIRNLRWNKVKLNENESSITLYSNKTKEIRTIPIFESVIHLRRYKQEFPYENIKHDDYIFPSPKDRNKPVKAGVFTYYIKRLGKQTLNRDVFPYLLRHSMLTRIYKKVSTETGSKFAGHSSAMADRYTHLSHDDVRQELMSKIFHVEEITAKGRKEFEKQIKKLEEQYQNHNQILHLLYNYFLRLKKGQPEKEMKEIIKIINPNKI